MVKDLATVSLMVVLCAGAVVRDDEGRLLVVRRGNAPSAGLWSLPGGRVEPGESLAATARREVLEETGLVVEVGAVAGYVELPGLADDVYAVTDFFARVVGDASTPLAGDDAAEVRWVTRDELARLDCTPGLLDTLTAWNV